MVQSFAVGDRVGAFLVLNAFNGVLFVLRYVLRPFSLQLILVYAVGLQGILRSGSFQLGLLLW